MLFNPANVLFALRILMKCNGTLSGLVDGGMSACIYRLKRFIVCHCTYRFLCEVAGADCSAYLTDLMEFHR